jgi:hypothetical protein
MLNIIERQPGPVAAAERLHDMLVLGLCGLGIDEARAREVAAASAARLRSASAREQA